MAGVLWTIIVLLFIFWLVGFLVHFAGGFIHILLAIILILIIWNLLAGRRARV